MLERKREYGANFGDYELGGQAREELTARFGASTTKEALDVAKSGVCFVVDPTGRS